LSPEEVRSWIIFHLFNKQPRINYLLDATTTIWWLRTRLRRMPWTYEIFPDEGLELASRCSYHRLRWWFVTSLTFPARSRLLSMAKPSMSTLSWPSLQDPYQNSVTREGRTSLMAKQWISWQGLGMVERRSVIWREMSRQPGTWQRLTVSLIGLSKIDLTCYR
jgi:hypothetical protein